MRKNLTPDEILEGAFVFYASLELNAEQLEVLETLLDERQKEKLRAVLIKGQEIHAS